MSCSVVVTDSDPSGEFAAGGHGVGVVGAKRPRHVGQHFFESCHRRGGVAGLALGSGQVPADGHDAGVLWTQYAQCIDLQLLQGSHRAGRVAGFTSPVGEVATH